jgi:hypothetical protein
MRYSQLKYAVYSEMGTRNRKTGRLPYYTVRRELITDIWDCTCPASEFQRYTECKHIKSLKHRLRMI